MRRGIATRKGDITTARPAWLTVWLGAVLAAPASGDAIRQGPSGPDPSGALPAATATPGLGEVEPTAPSPWENWPPPPAREARTHPPEAPDDEEGDDNRDREAGEADSPAEAPSSLPSHLTPASPLPSVSHPARPGSGSDPARAPSAGQARPNDGLPRTGDKLAATDPLPRPPAGDGPTAPSALPAVDTEPSMPWTDPSWRIGQELGTPVDLGLPLADPLDPIPGIPAGWDTDANIGKLIDASIATEMRRNLLHATAPAASVARATALAGDDVEDSNSLLPVVGDPALGVPVSTPEPAPLALVALIFLYGWKKTRAGGEVSTRGR